MTIFGQINFWSISTVTLLMWAWIKFLRALWYPNPRSSTRKILWNGITWKMENRVFKFMIKSCMVAMATCTTADWWNWNFLNRNLPERKSRSRNSKPQAVLKIFCDFSKGHKVPLAWMGLRNTFSPKDFCNSFRCCCKKNTLRNPHYFTRKGILGRNRNWLIEFTTVSLIN